jgi:hypothetical protein
MGGIGRQLAEHLAQRMLEPQFVVAEGENQQRRRRVDTAAEILGEIERRPVGPVHVLEDQHHGPSAVAQQGQ